MKRKMSIILLSFLAFGAFGAMHNANNDFNAPTKLVVAEENVRNVTIHDIWNFHGGMFASVRFESGFDPSEYDEFYVNDRRVDNFRQDGDAFIMNGFNDEGKSSAYLFKFYKDGALVAQAIFVRSVDAPTDVIINEGKLEFTPNPIADKHSLQYLRSLDDSVAATEDNVESGYMLRTDLEAGTYKIQVQAHYGDKVSDWADADKTYEIAAADAEKLNAPTNVHVSDGVLTFDNVENAAYYLIEYVKDGSTVASENAEESPYELNKNLKAGSYNIRVSAMNDDPNFKSSDYTEAPEVYEIEFVAIELEILNIWNFHGGAFASVKFASWDETKFNMSDVSYFYVNENRETACRPDGDAFIMQGFYDEGKAEKYVIKFYNADDLLLAQGTYSNEVILPSEPVKLSAPEGLVIHPEEGTLAFANVTNATGYHVQYRQDEETKYEHDITNGGLLNPDKNYAEGVYDIYIKTLGDGENYLDSDYVTAGQFVITRDFAVEANEYLAKWRALFNGSSICDALANRIDDVKALIAEYDALDSEVRAIVDAAELKDLGIEDTFETHMNWAKAVVSAKDSSSVSLTNTLLTSLNDSNSLSMAAILVGLSTLAFAGYFFISKRKLEK